MLLESIDINERPGRDRQIQIREAISEVLRDAGRAMTPQEIAERMDYSACGVIRCAKFWTRYFRLTTELDEKGRPRVALVDRHEHLKGWES